MSNTSFGQNVLTNNFDPAVLNGWGVRPSDWNLGVSFQQQIRARSSVDVTYTRRWYHGFFVADNLALQPSDLTPFRIVAPADARLPGGAEDTRCRVFTTSSRTKPERSTISSRIRRRTGAWSQYFNGVDEFANKNVGLPGFVRDYVVKTRHLRYIYRLGK